MVARHRRVVGGGAAGERGGPGHDGLVDGDRGGPGDEQAAGGPSPARDGLPEGEAAAWQARVARFLATQQGRPVVVYVGTPSARRNYERLLQLACDIDGCFVHCGATHDSSGYPHDPAARRELISRSALLESGAFYQDFETARATYAAARCVALPYGPEHLTSSGAMLQALMAGRPVLVPDRGLMAHRVQDFGLGLTFAPDDWQDLRAKFVKLDATPPGAFDARIERFLGYFSRTQFEAAMDAALGLSPSGARLPGED